MYGLTRSADADKGRHSPWRKLRWGRAGASGTCFQVMSYPSKMQLCYCPIEMAC